MRRKADTTHKKIIVFLRFKFYARERENVMLAAAAMLLAQPKRARDLIQCLVRFATLLLFFSAGKRHIGYLHNRLATFRSPAPHSVGSATPGVGSNTMRWRHQRFAIK